MALHTLRLAFPCGAAGNPILGICEQRSPQLSVVFFGWAHLGSPPHTDLRRTASLGPVPTGWQQEATGKEKSKLVKGPLNCQVKRAVHGEACSGERSFWHASHLISLRCSSCSCFCSLQVEGCGKDLTVEKGYYQVGVTVVSHRGPRMRAGAWGARAVPSATVNRRRCGCTAARGCGCTCWAPPRCGAMPCRPLIALLRLPGCACISAEVPSVRGSPEAAVTHGG